MKKEKGEGMQYPTLKGDEKKSHIMLWLRPPFGNKTGLREKGSKLFILI